MGDRSPQVTAGGALGVHVNPLPGLGNVGERVHRSWVIASHSPGSSSCGSAEAVKTVLIV